MGLAEANKEVLEFLDNLSDDTDEDMDDDDGPTNTVHIQEEELTAVEVFREKTLEDIIEEQRAKLLAEGKKRKNYCLSYR